MKSASSFSSSTRSGAQNAGDPSAVDLADPLPGSACAPRRAAERSHKSLTGLILDSACLAAEQTLLDQRLFKVFRSQAQALMDLLERPEQVNQVLQDLFTRQVQGMGRFPLPVVILARLVV
ncbi:DUF1778 domain-containing protein [Cyanobium sp. BA5m-21]|uniref:type II toxin-antitoxin system TacA family antitoxin n=1 Tax=unclassified Cyanobium TaxID=2627006 RepID=UPI0020CBE5A2|nr:MULTISPECIES: DUF1778 domain-containing protein [unclassified Cyanobium]MCP9905276.1 DUF1778 domain-containing protein [Cyanobium sp. BA5m-10]MCP9908287.1 DUF1778 domain-containing protein [Cyanobium sp. BA5m-21]